MAAVRDERAGLAEDDVKAIISDVSKARFASQVRAWPLRCGWVRGWVGASPATCALLSGNGWRRPNGLR